MKVMALVSVASLTVLAAFAQAQPATPQQQAQTQQPGVPAAIPDGEKIVCEKQEVVGSRLATHKICMTKNEWARTRGDDQEWIKRTQQQRGYGTAPQ
jgi:invasion protein IalB